MFDVILISIFLYDKKLLNGISYIKGRVFQMKFKPTNDQLDRIFNPAYEDIMAICDDMDIETKCGSDYIIKFLENIVLDYKMMVTKLREEEENQ